MVKKNAVNQETARLIWAMVENIVSGYSVRRSEEVFQILVTAHNPKLYAVFQTTLFVYTFK
jgi:hypothetical protein